MCNASQNPPESQVPTDIYPPTPVTQWQRISLGVLIPLYSRAELQAERFPRAEEKGREAEEQGDL